MSFSLVRFAILIKYIQSVYVSLIILCQFEGCGFLRQDRTEKAVRYFQFREWSFNTGGQTHSLIASESDPLHLQVSF